MKSSLQFLYLFLKINGLIPFKFDFDKQEAIHTATSLRYSVIFSLIFWSYLTYYVCVICTSIISVEKEVLLMSVVLIDIIAAFFKTLCVYIIQLVNSRKIVESINSLMKLCEEIFGKDFRLTSCFSDSNLRKSFQKKLLSVSVQAVSLTIAFFVSEYNAPAPFYYMIQNLVFTLWVNLITTTINSVFYCGSMLFVTRFYEILDGKARMLGHFTDGRVNVNDCIDRMYLVREQIATFTTKVCSIYVLQIVYLLIGIIIWATASVSKELEFFVHLILYVILAAVLFVR